MCLNMNRKVHAVCNFNSRVETEVLLNVTESHVYYKVVISPKRCKIDTL